MQLHRNMPMPGRAIAPHSDSSLDRLIAFISSVLFMLVLGFPFIFVTAKLILGGFLIILMHLSPNRQSSRFDVVCFSILVVNAIYLYMPYVFGTYNDISFEFLFPLHIIFVAFWWIVFRLFSVSDIDRLVRVAIFAGWLSWTYSMLLLLSGLGFIPFEIPNVYDTVNVNTEIVELASNFVSALLFTSPIITYHYLKSPTPVSLLKLFILWVGILATGRRSAFFGLGVCLLFLAFESFQSIKSAVLAALLLVVLAVAASTVYAFDVLSVGAMIDERLDSLNLQDEVIRVDQAWSLWEEFLDKPIFGHGLGSNVTIIRDEEKVWRYELSYIAALFRFGVMGCFAYLLLYGVPLWNCIVNYKQFSTAQKSIIVAISAQVMAYAVNPVFDTFDTCWQLLLPVLLVTTARKETLKSRPQMRQPYQNLQQLKR
jgi:hypothetical protein